MKSKDEIYYCKPVYRPPSEAYSLLIQVTEGCTYRCHFCVSNLRKKFLIRELNDIKKDLEIAYRIYGPNVKRVFFLDGNAMVTPTNKLLELTKYAYELFPHLERCSVYAHARDILKKTPEQLNNLSEAGLILAYVGFESGYDKILKHVNKNATKKEYIEASKKLMDANITLSATFINGIGGANNPELSEKHAVESADLVNKICPDDDRIWYIAFLTLMIPSGTEIYRKKMKGEFQEMNSVQILEELKAFISKIHFHNHEANLIFRSNHASNYLPLRGILDREKDKILEVIDYGLSHTEVLRPEFYRGL
jgi:radical SAM superfamily enzyme YgiQ (UPF0313 family)